MLNESRRAQGFGPPPSALPPYPAQTAPPAPPPPPPAPMAQRDPFAQMFQPPVAAQPGMQGGTQMFQAQPQAPPQPQYAQQQQPPPPQQQQPQYAQPQYSQPQAPPAQGPPPQSAQPPAGALPPLPPQKVQSMGAVTVEFHRLFADDQGVATMRASAPPLVPPHPAATAAAVRRSECSSRAEAGRVYIDVRSSPAENRIRRSEGSGCATTAGRAPAEPGCVRSFLEPSSLESSRTAGARGAAASAHAAQRAAALTGVLRTRVPAPATSRGTAAFSTAARRIYANVPTARSASAATGDRPETREPSAASTGRGASVVRAAAATAAATTVHAAASRRWGVHADVPGSGTSAGGPACRSAAAGRAASRSAGRWGVHADVSGS